MSKDSGITVTDQFCGAGGSSVGATEAGATVRLAMNHWKLAIETHNANFPTVDHDCTDISAVDPRRYPSTNILITSPECTNHSLAKGKARQYYEQDLFGNFLLDPADERSRATMWDVPRFAEFHEYDLIVSENVVDAGKWRLFESWLHAMHSLDYEHEVVYFNSMFAWPTPQSRDRMYTIFWKRGNKKPDLEFRPSAWCQLCQLNVDSIQTWKTGKWGRYKAQYFYRCPSCHKKVEPYYYAAFNAIDFTLPAKRIGDRKRPLKPKTLARIQYGLDTYGHQPMIVTGRYTTGIGSRVKDALQDVLPTQPGDASHAVVMPWIVETGYSSGPDNRLISSMDPGLTQTTRQTFGVVDFIAELRGSSKASGLEDPLMCITTSGAHHALLSADACLTYYYGNSIKSGSMNDPIHTVTSRDRVGLAQGLKSMTVDDLTFRMLSPREIGKAMAFKANYTVKGNHREQVRQYGNAVTPPVMKMLMQRCVATFQ